MVFKRIYFNCFFNFYLFFKNYLKIMIIQIYKIIKNKVLDIKINFKILKTS